MKKSILYSLLMVIIGSSIELSAKTTIVKPLSMSHFADSEISTNIVFNELRSDLKTLNIRLDSARSDANSVQIAFGGDLNGNGDLEPEEAVLVVGRRQCNYFVEDVAEGVRYMELAGAAAAQGAYLEVEISTDRSFVPKTIDIQCENGRCFGGMAAEPWMYRTDWNLIKITRRGTIADEWCRVHSTYRAMMWMLR